jgi:LysR family transcriptional regulator, regulator for genes of the gallate degradation pathway
MHPELRHLRAFLAVVEQGSAHRAGAALFRAQSAVSRSIRRLENELGVQLFERRSRGMLLTEYGKALLLRARRVQQELQLARTEIASMIPAHDERNAAIFSMLTHERRVRAIVALAERQHMPSVAESIGVTQPAISMAVRQLEESIGTPLFQRSARGMLPTLAGAALVLHLKRAFAEVRHAVADIDALRGRTQGTVTVGALPLGRTRLLPEAIAALVDAWPGLRVATVEGTFESLSAGLRSGDIDFILGALRPAEAARDFEGIGLARNRLAIIARRDHPLARRRRLRPNDLASARWVLSRASTPNRTLFERAMRARGLAPPNVVVETSDLAVMRGVLVQSDLLTAISARQLAYELDAGLVRELPFELPETERVIGITRRADSVSWPGARLLMDEIARRAPDVLDPLDHASTDDRTGEHATPRATRPVRER